MIAMHPHGENPGTKRVPNPGMRQHKTSDLQRRGCIAQRAGLDWMAI